MAVTIRRQSLSDQVYDLLFQRIASGELRPGAQLVLSEVAEEMGVSQTPVRDALQQLVARGLVEKRGNQGWAVVRPTPTDIREIFEIREALEGMAARLMAERGSREDIAELRRIMEDLRRAAGSGDFREYCRRDIEFHSHLVRGSGNARLANGDSYDALVVLSFAELRPYSEGGVDAPWETATTETHPDVVRAIEARDPDAAEREAREHLRKAARGLQRWYAERRQAEAKAGVE